MARLRVLLVLFAMAALPAGALAQRVAGKPYLNMPQTVQGALPAHLSDTGAFADVRTLKPIPAAIPYELVQSFWSDGAAKSRFVVVPDAKIGFSPTGEWTFPSGTVFVKTFELPTDQRAPAQRLRLETRLLVVGEAGAVYGATYRWRADLSDADLVNDAVTKPVAVRSPDGAEQTQNWYFPSREDCLTCHTSRAGGVLGVKTRQMNRPVQGTGSPKNQLVAWDRLGLFTADFDAAQIENYPRLARSDDATRSLEDRARSYLDANCSQCHRPGGTVAYFDARYDTPLERQSLVDGRVLIDEGLDRARVIAPHDPWRSIALARIDTNADIRMPPLARQSIDAKGVALIREWIGSLPGRPVLEPPVVSPAGGGFHGAVTVTLQAGEGATVHYTLDGSAPGEQDPRYEEPIQIAGPTILRARAFREGYTRSIAIQQNYLPDN